MGRAFFFLSGKWGFVSREKKREKSKEKKDPTTRIARVLTEQSMAKKKNYVVFV